MSDSSRSGPKKGTSKKTMPGYSTPSTRPRARNLEEDTVVDPEASKRAEVEASGEGPADVDSEEQVLPVERRADPPAPKRRRGTPVIEIEVVHEHGPAPSTERPFRTLEVWTRNRVYTLDSVMTCMEVRDRATRELVADHPFLGMRLVGGQHREGESIELSYPFPRPGTEAVFEHPGGKRGGTFSRTSAVTRVVLRLHIVTVSPNYVVPTWEEITGALEVPRIVDRRDE